MRSFFIVLAVSSLSSSNLTPNPSPIGEGSIYTLQQKQQQEQYILKKQQQELHNTFQEQELYTPLSNRRGVGGEAAVGEAVKASFLFTGDILLDRGVRRFIEKKGVDALFSQGIDSLFSTAHIVVGNLECPATKVKAPVFKRYIFRGEPVHLSTLRKHGFTHLNLCNNHSIDQGREGLMDTKRNIERAGMIPAGVGRNMAEAAQPVLLTKKPRNVWLLTSLRMALENWALLNDRPCVSQEPMDSLILRIRRLKKSDPKAVVIVSLHWGGEHTLRPVPLQRMEAHALINAGADALICHHTHTLQTIEEYKGKKIFYSIGNFIFDQPKPLNSKACVVKLTVTENEVKAEPVPIIIRNCVPLIERNH
jgi:poly-gamma-glutamate synthesis protein (capsule biosynthesis protein)